MKKALVIGAGPAGLTAAYELLQRTDIIPIVIEKTGDIGGISKTVNYKGNRMDIGGHRFFSKSDRVMQWWMNILPIEADSTGAVTISYQNKQTTVDASIANPQPSAQDKVMLIRSRLSRIYFLKKFFSYPLKLSIETLQKLGIWRSARIIFSYLAARLRPIKPEKSLEDFFVNKFGRELYLTFFKDYTEKVWGIKCNEISPEWGAQRIKGVSISKAIGHALKKHLSSTSQTISQKDTETSLIERFLYPKYGPGQLWEEVAATIQQKGGTILLSTNIEEIFFTGKEVSSVVIINQLTGHREQIDIDYLFSSMPVQELVAKIRTEVPPEVKGVAEGLIYRDFITVGVLLRKFSLDKHAADGNSQMLQDNWIYIQDKNVQVGRLQIFNNWSPFMVKDSSTVWLGMEYFCNKGDDLWQMDEKSFTQLAIRELETIGLIKTEDVLDTHLVRMEKAYPAYFGTYHNFETVRIFTDQFPNLFLIGRNGMHKYNNSDHSMLTAMTAVDNICMGRTDKTNIWDINTEQEYHETSNNG